MKHFGLILMIASVLVALPATFGSLDKVSAGAVLLVVFWSILLMLESLSIWIKLFAQSPKERTYANLGFTFLLILTLIWCISLLFLPNRIEILSWVANILASSVPFFVGHFFYFRERN